MDGNLKDKGLFKTYIDKWINVKIQSKKDNNGAMYRIANMLNSMVNSG